MTCPDCRRSHKAGQARLLTCRCGYRFVFDPRQHNGLTDGKFLARLRRIIWHLDDSIGDPITVPNFELAARAAQDVRRVFI